MESKPKFRVLYIDDFDELRPTVAEIEGKHYSVIGNGMTLKVKDIKRDWGKDAKWGRYIKI